MSISSLYLGLDRLRQLLEPEVGSTLLVPTRSRYYGESDGRLRIRHEAQRHGYEAMRKEELFTAPYPSSTRRCDHRRDFISYGVTDAQPRTHRRHPAVSAGAGPSLTERNAARTAAL